MALQSKNEQRIVIKIYTLLGNSYSEIRRDLHAVNWDSCLSFGTILKWMNCFKDGRETAEDDKYTGQTKR